MSSMAEVYTENLHKHFRILYANWPPGSPIELGDFGILTGDIFIRKGNILDKYKINFKKIIDKSKDDYEYKSSDSTEVNFNSKGSVNPNGLVNAKASIEIKFSSNESIFFTASDCVHNYISNVEDIGEKIIDLWDKDKWDEDNVIITSKMNSAATTIIVSKGNSSSIKLEATSDAVESIKLSDASIGLGIVSESNIGFKVITKEGMTPLFEIMGLKNKYKPFWPFTNGKKFELERDLTKVETISNKDKPKKVDVFFGKLA